MRASGEDELVLDRAQPDSGAAPLEARPVSGGHTRQSARVAAMTAWGTLVLLWSTTIGIPNDALTVLITLWLGTIAWHVQAPWRRHLGFLRDWSVPALLLTAYFYSRGLIDELDVTVHWTMPIEADRWLFGGTTPTETLQHAWCGDPCRLESPVRWFEVVMTTVYASHFLVGLVLAVLLWATSRTEWLVWMRRYIGLNLAGLAIYVAYPMAPPWLASDEGHLGHVERITSRGWGDLGIERANVVLDGVGNPVAAMPSLHAGTAVLVALYGIWRLRSPGRWLLVLYPGVMCVALVYFGEHYVVDLVAGGLLAGAVMLLAHTWERRHRPRPHSPDDGATERSTDREVSL
ncbi:phosphatase PAP2 family protein [Nocardioides lijunqiniae]|uniref:phosphatase PAP2 family protein n=1 Tax=Nocardioides lijunqiniae TaxID=2760832 RepID=UPI001877B5F7|nr:phosphatase PAP2 family protein [Nocardioides lijunqiniae]